MAGGTFLGVISMNAGWGEGSVIRSFRAVSQSGGPGLPLAAGPGDLLEIQIFKLLPRPTESETLGMDPVMCVLTSPPDNPGGNSN